MFSRDQLERAATLTGGDFVQIPSAAAVAALLPYRASLAAAELIDVY
jgi:hypothetical protein